LPPPMIGDITMPQNIPSRLIYAAQIRAARGLLNWSQGELAERAGVSKQSVTRIEAGTMDPRFSTMTALNEAIRGAGVEMAEDINGTVRLTVSRDKLLPPSG
jgi:predicted transcriptional regulator